jgi:predicted transcriptional regulator
MLSSKKQRGLLKMIAIKTLVIRFEGWDSFKSRVTSALKKKKPSIGKKDTLTFASVTDYQKFMTEQKIAILATIIRKKPSSIYQLAQLVERDFANVQRDCIALEGMGFIRLEDAGDAKKSKLPRLAFNYTRIEIHMPQVTYSHDLGEAA